MKLVKWDPFEELSNLNGVLERSFNRHSEWPGPRMEIDAVETENDLLITASVAGATKDSFTIDFHDQLLSLKAHIEKDEEFENARYHLRERTTGEISRTLRIPFRVDVEQAQANFANGVLRLRLPKATSSRKKSIQIS